MRSVSVSTSAIARITPTGPATGLAELTGAGFQGIGVAITGSGSTVITDPAD